MISRSVLGVRVDDVTYDEAIRTIDGFVRAGGRHMVTTPNPEIVMMARGDPRFMDLLNGAALAIPDGVGLLWAGRLAGLPFREHVRGTDLILRLAGHSARAGFRWFLLGAEPGVAQRAAVALARREPRLRITGAYAGLAGPEGDADTRAAIAAAGGADIVLVAYGAPAQERWMARNLDAAGVPVGIGVGGVFNYLAGVAPRAPAWLRTMELEWLHRLLTQPWRWRRQLALPRFVLTVLIGRYWPGAQPPVVSIDPRCLTGSTDTRPH
jgi:N-acetylglucosaminyldiphosphoundecaprenol N-acetyl-beta-D-mannosaminyltransferase